MSAKVRLAASIKSALLFAIIQQVFVFTFFSILIYDAESLLQIFLFAAVAFWGATIILILRRGASPTKLDLIFVRSGYLPTCVLALFVTGLIWNLRKL